MHVGPSTPRISKEDDLISFSPTKLLLFPSCGGGESMAVQKNKMFHGHRGWRGGKGGREGAGQILPLNIPNVRGCTRSRSRRRRRDGGGVLFDAGRRRSSKLVIFSIVGDVDRSPRGSLTSSGRSGITYYTYRTRLVHFTFAIRFVP